LLAASLSSTYGFRPESYHLEDIGIGQLETETYVPDELVIAEPHRLEDISIGQLGTETYVPDELVSATPNVVITLSPRRAVTCGDKLS
jgi:hypothetical protein